MKLFFTILCAVALLFVGVEAYLDEFQCGPENCYDVLGIDKSAKPKDIQKAYRSKAKLLHPDVRKNEPDDEKRGKMEDDYIRLNKAYDILKKVESRKEYDALVADPFRYNVLKRKYYGGGKNVYVHPAVPIILLLIGGSVLQRVNRNNMMANERRRCMLEIINNKQWLDATNAILASNDCEAEMAELKEKDQGAWAKKALELNPVEMVLHVKPVETSEIFAIQVCLFPYTALMWLMSLKSGKDKKMTRADKIARTANAFGISEAQLIRRTDQKMISDGDYLGDLDMLLKKKLWKEANMNKLRDDNMEQRLKKIPKHQRANARKEMIRADKEARELAMKEQFMNKFAQ